MEGDFKLLRKNKGVCSRGGASVIKYETRDSRDTRHEILCIYCFSKLFIHKIESRKYMGLNG